jgi:homocysteine S-methyltransferase
MDFEILLRTEKHILSQGSVYELLRRSPEVVFDEHIFHAGLIYDENSAGVLERVFRAYIDTAVASRLSISMATATWRANEERIRASIFSDRTVNEDNVRFLNRIRASYAGSGIFVLIRGDIGPRGDAYKPEEALDAKSAQSFHSYQIDRLASCDIDYLQASTVPALSEATGIALAMAETGLPYALSFVVNRSGCLLDGTKLSDAMQSIDDAVGNNSARYAINCVHPEILHQALDKNPDAEGRIISFSGNTANLSPEELNGREDLVSQEPAAFARVNKRLLDAHDIPIVGACCGSGPNHIREIADVLVNWRH